MVHVGVEPTEIVDPAPEAGIPIPPPVDATTFVTWTDSELFTRLEASWNVAVARTPLLNIPVFMPETTQVVLPDWVEHVTLLFAATALVPAVTVTPVTSDVG